MAECATPLEIWNKTIRYHNIDSQFWWDRTGCMFGKLLQKAGYSVLEQYRELSLYALFVAPELGPAPDSEGNVRWRSPGTPDFTPIDFSWEWGPNDEAVVRFSFEPIGPHAGTELDPLNSSATDVWINKLWKHELAPSLDLEWYRHFTSEILPSYDAVRTRTVEDFIEETTPKAGTVVALDMERSGPVVKIYIYPGLKAMELGMSNLDLVKKAVRSLPEEQYQLLDVEPLLDYLDEGTCRWGFETGILSIDCVKPQDSRIKIYVRAPWTTLDYLIDALTLGGRLHLPDDEALADTKALWQTFLADAPDKLPCNAAGRASPGFYYSIGCKKGISPKMYLCPQFFCQSDTEVLSKLRGYFSTRRSDHMMENYECAIRNIFGDTTLENRCGSHYYIGCGIAKGQMRVVTYLNPQTFTCEKDSAQVQQSGIEDQLSICTNRAIEHGRL